MYRLIGLAHLQLMRAGQALREGALREPALRDARGQGTVEYVALILLVALVMAGVVAAMKGFRTGEGKELGDVIIGKIKEAVKKVQF
jgi:Flp pilus assembly pilin Flp